MRALLLGSLGLAVGGPLLGLACAGGAAAYSLRRPRSSEPGLRPILLVLLVELRSGRSVLAALQQAAIAFPDHAELALGTRVATVDGLSASVEATTGEVRHLLTQLARAQRSGSSVSRTVRLLLETDIANDRASRLARAKGLPVRLMVPISLLLLPGLMLLIYAPSLLRLLGDLTGPLT